MHACVETVVIQGAPPAGEHLESEDLQKLTEQEA